MKDKKIIVDEISTAKVSEISPGLIDFTPKKCLACGNKSKIVQRFFLLSQAPKMEGEHKKIKRILGEKYGLTYYGYLEGNKKVITTAKCPECDNEKMDWDY